MANKLIQALYAAKELGIEFVGIDRLHIETGIPKPEIDTPQAWGEKSWGELQRKQNIYRKGKGKAVKFFVPSVDELLKSIPSSLNGKGQTLGKYADADTSTTGLIAAQEDLTLDSVTTAEIIDRAESLLGQLEVTSGFIPVQVAPSPVTNDDDDDDIEEGDSDRIKRRGSKAAKPNWKTIFGELDAANPIYSRLAAIAACYYHPSFDFDEYSYLVGLIRDIFDNLDVDRAKVSKLSNELAQWKPSAKFGVLLMGMLNFATPKFLVKNPCVSFQSGAYVFKDGARPSKLPLFFATGKTKSGKSEIIKLLSMVADGTYVTRGSSASLMTKIAEVKDRRLGSGEYNCGWKGLPIEHFNPQTETFENLICLIPDLSKKGSDFEKLESALKAVCEQDMVIDRQSASLDRENKTWLLSGANVAISSCYSLSDDPNHPIAELIRRAVVIGCHGLESEEALKIKDKMLNPELIDWQGFSLSYTWQKFYRKTSGGNLYNKLVVEKDPKTKEMIYRFVNAESEVRQWGRLYGINVESIDFIVSILSFALVCWIDEHEFIEEKFLVDSLKYYLDNSSIVLNTQNTSTEFTEQFEEILNAAISRLQKAKNNPRYAFDIGIDATLIQKHYTNTAKRLLASKKDIPSLTELMSSLGYEARIKDVNGVFFEDANGEIETRYFLVENAELKV